MHICRLQSITAEPEAIVTQQAIWQDVTALQHRFWPLLYFSRSKYQKHIEAVYPIKCKLAIAGWGKLKLKIRVLAPTFEVCWDEKYWYVSAEGKIWPTDIAENRIIDIAPLKSRAIVYWAEDRVTPYEIGNENGSVKTTALPITCIISWYENLLAVEWLDKIKAIKTETNDGMQVVRLIVKKRDGSSGASILMPDNPENWLVTGLAVNKICNDIQLLSQNDFIDATYKDKILVKNAVQ